jgi:hypothetical protein
MAPRLCRSRFRPTHGDDELSITGLPGSSGTERFPIRTETRFDKAPSSPAAASGTRWGRLAIPLHHKWPHEMTNCSKIRPTPRQGRGYLYKSRIGYLILEATYMGLIQGVVDGFIITVGITPPTPENKRSATIFIATGLIGTVLGVAALLAFVLSRLA